MALDKKSKKQSETLSIDGELLKSVSYATFYNRRPLFNVFRMSNSGTESVENITVSITGSTQLILPTTLNVAEIPQESSMEIASGNLLNPKYLAEVEEVTPCTVSVKLLLGKTEARTFDAEITVLPIDCWSGISGNVEILASFVRPKLTDCQKIKSEAGLQLKTWGYSAEWSGYSGSDKNSVRNAQASIFSAIRHLNIERDDSVEEDYSSNVRVGDPSAIIAAKKATPIELALFTASCLEAVKLNPVIVIGKNKIGVGVWLYEGCFTTAAQDDMSVVEKYVSEGVNNIAVFSVDDLFAHRNASYTTSESHFASALASGKYEVLLDVKRSRIGGIFPVPLKVKTGTSYEMLSDDEISYESKPKEIIDAARYEYDKKDSKENNWQRRLLDLSMKNNLLNFRSHRECLHLQCADLSSFCEKLSSRQNFTLSPAVQTVEVPTFGAAAKIKNLGELISIEMTSGVVRTFTGAAELNDKSASLIRKARAMEEEAGANTLCLALGYLQWKHKDEREFKYAPLSVLPVTLKRGKQNVTLEISDDFQVNTTLLEFLKREFGIDIRGVEGKGLTPAEVSAVFRGKTSDIKDWAVYDDVYLAQFTFARYAMWRDVKENIDEFKKNELVNSLISNANKITHNKLSNVGEDDIDPVDLMVPLSSDSSQYAAVAESEKDCSFVLHGPPGTGKSQTITNIIANALDKGRRVLFVAEKQAALQVVKKRLTDIGIGEFCLELHSGKADKSALIANIDNVLSLSGTHDDDAFNAMGERLKETRETLRAPLAALHKKRRLGVSVYDGILIYLQNKNAPELVDIESTFYDSLTAKKLQECEDMILTAQVAAKECGGVYRSPFDNVNITDCDGGVKEGIQISAEVVLAELKHLKNYTGLFLDAFNQKMSTFTNKKLSGLVEVATMLQSGALDVFFECDEESFYKFYNANVRYDSEVKHWMIYFKDLPDLGKQWNLVEKEIDTWDENYRSSRLLITVLKQLSRISRAPIKEKDELEWLKRAYEIERARSVILSTTNLSSNFTGLGGTINDKKRAEFLRPLYRMHSLNATIFMDYNADAFNSVCIRAVQQKNLSPLLNGMIAAANSFTASCNEFCTMIKADTTKFDDEDILEYYSTKCSALIDNIDMLPAWCLYKNTAKQLNDNGLSFMTDAMESGRINGEQIIASFRKNVYRNFVQTNIPADDDLAHFSAAILDETSANFSVQLENFSKLTKEKLRADLISRLPAQGTEGSLSLELITYQRSIKGNVRAFNIRSLFTEIPELMKVMFPCLLMSPSTVSQYLPPDPEMFDMVIFDEASQVPTAEAVPTLARGKKAIIVGDPKQLPPTSFFMNIGADDENTEMEDLESVLEDCLALGIPEKHLNWHYRSKHESLIAFSNIMYYGSKLCTFPSPDALDSKVTLRLIEDGVYDRGGSKCNKQEADALVADVMRRLKDEKLRRSSIGIVTFSTPQQEYIERTLHKAIFAAHLEAEAFEREEPIFVKNLENVQGDERDVILFSVCYGPDRYGRISLNFGPLNQYGGWRRLNVAVSRAREEMVVFSSMRYSVIDLSRTTSKGVAGLKAFLEFAEKGRTNIAVKSDEVILNKNSIGKFVAAELENYGYECRCNVGVSDFKIDVGVIDPANKHNFILAVMCDGSEKFSIKDRTVMQIQTLKRNNWNVIRLYSINFFNNPKREIKKIKEYLDKLTSGGGKPAVSYKKPYKAAKYEAKQADAQYILSGENDAEVLKIIKAIVAAEEPISAQFLIKRTLSAFGITKCGVKLESKLRALIDKCSFASNEMLGNVYYFRTDKYSGFDRYRVEEGTTLRQSADDYAPYDVISLIKSILLNKVSMYSDELIAAVIKELRIPRSTDKYTSLINSCIDEGVSEGIFIRSISDKISLC